MANLQIHRDRHDRLHAQLVPGVAAAIRIFAESDTRLVRYNVHGYAVVDIKTPLGTLRIRGVEIVWNTKFEKFCVRWPKQRFGAKQEGAPDHLDVVGPHDRASRMKYQDLLLDLFHQVRAAVQAGKEFPKLPEAEALQAAL